MAGFESQRRKIHAFAVGDSHNGIPCFRRGVLLTFSGGNAIRLDLRGLFRIILKSFNYSNGFE